MNSERTNESVVTRRALLGSAIALLTAGCGGGGSSGVVTPTPAPVMRGQLIGYRSIGTVPGATCYAIDYGTVDALGAPITASGLFAAPQGAVGARPMVCYFHGTTTLHSDVPSAASSLEGSAVAQLFGSAGYVVVAPDYPGLGDDTKSPQTFEQAAPLAAMAVDFLTATQTLARQLSIGLSGKLFLSGFSEGGYAAMVVQRAVEAQPALIGSLTITANAPIAGPYDLSGTTFQSALSAPGPDTPALVASLLVGYNPIYKLYNTPSDVFAAPYAAAIPGLFDGTHSLGQIAAVLPATVPALLTPAYLASLQANPDAPLLTALRANDVYDWKNVAPIRLYHSPTDELVSYQNAVVAQKRISARGGDIQIVPIGRNADHTTTPALAASLILAYFGTL